MRKAAGRAQRDRTEQVAEAEKVGHGRGVKRTSRGLTLDKG